VCQGDLAELSDAADLARWIVLFNQCLLYTDQSMVPELPLIAESVRCEMGRKVDALCDTITDVELTRAVCAAVQCPNGIV